MNIGACVVTAEIIGNGTKHLVKITIDATPQDGNEADAKTVTATDHHPFWVEGPDKWTDATDLERSDWLRTGAGTLVQVTAVERWTQQTTVHNLTVTDLQTYYVLAGATPVLVHNSNCAFSVGLLSKSHKAIGDPSAKGGVYALVSENGTVMRTGMATNLQSRMAKHRRTYPGLTPVALYRTDSRSARRGLEQMAENRYSPILANQRAIRMNNPRRQGYMQAARDFLDQWG